MTSCLLRIHSLRFFDGGLHEVPVEEVMTVALIAIFILQSPNQKIPDRKTKCVIKTHINIKQNVIFGAKLKPV